HVGKLPWHLPISVPGRHSLSVRTWPAAVACNRGALPHLPGGPVPQHACCCAGVCRLCRGLCRDQCGLQPALVDSCASAPPAVPNRNASPGKAADTPHSAGIAGVRACNPAGVLESLCESGTVQLPVDLLGLHLL